MDQERFKSFSVSEGLELALELHFLTDRYRFFLDHGLYEFVHNLGVDHLAIKATSSAEYEAYIQHLISIGLKVHERDMRDGRRISIVELEYDITVGSHGETKILEVMEPKPGKSGLGLGEIDHIELLHADLSTVSNILLAKGVFFEKPPNSYHQTVVVQINDRGQEIKFTNKPIIQVVAEQERDGS